MTKKNANAVKRDGRAKMPEKFRTVTAGLVFSGRDELTDILRVTLQNE